MKRLLLLLALALILPPPVCPAAQTVAHLYSRSVLVYQGQAADVFGSVWTMDLTTINAGSNGELAPDFFNSGYSNSTMLALHSQKFNQTWSGKMFVNIPDSGDANSNGIPDFFEVKQPVTSITSTGAYQFDSPFDSGPFTASWSRDAESANGGLYYSIPDPFHPGFNLAFSHPIAVIEYDGQLAYTPAATNVAAVLSVMDTNSGNTLDGPLAFVKVATNRAGQLILQSAFLTNAALQTLSLYTNTIIQWRPTYPTNYFGPVELQDGDPNTAERDYASYWLSVNDRNDADHDGVPDFSDDPAGIVPRRPVLTLTRGTNNLLLKISGDVGHLHYLLERTNLITGSWKTNLSFTLTSDPQTMALPLPPDKAKFWRAQAQ